MYSRRTALRYEFLNAKYYRKEFCGGDDEDQEKAKFLRIVKLPYLSGEWGISSKTSIARFAVQPEYSHKTQTGHQAMDTVGVCFSQFLLLLFVSLKIDSEIPRNPE